jgi:hypothetical protein
MKQFARIVLTLVLCLAVGHSVAVTGVPVTRAVDPPTAVVQGERQLQEFDRQSPSSYPGLPPMTARGEERPATLPGVNVANVLAGTAVSVRVLLRVPSR